MLLATIVIVLLAGITYYHYIQGGFTSAISAVSALIAMLVAFGYYESVLVLFPAGRVADFGAAMLLMAIYGVTYLVLRLLFDALVPGNIRLPLWVDRGFAVFFGLIAAVMGTGVFAVGAQLLPFGPTVGMHARYAVQDRQVTVPRDALAQSRNDLDYQVRDQLVADELKPGAGSGLLFPVDDMVLSIVSQASANAFASTNSFSTNHPDLLTEAFANRLGPDVGGKRVIVNTETEKAVAVAASGGLFILDAVPASGDTEIKKLRPNEKLLTLTKDSNKKIVVVRVRFSDSAADPDGYVRVTPSAAPLMLAGEPEYPIGAMTAKGEIALFRIDDQMVISMKDQFRSADLVYYVRAGALDKVAPKGKFGANSAYLQLKLFGRIDLSNRQADENWTPNAESRVLVKKASQMPPPPTPPVPAAQPPVAN